MSATFYIYAVTEENQRNPGLLTAYRWDKLAINVGEGQFDAIWKAERCIIKAAQSLRTHMQKPLHVNELDGGRVLVRFAVPPSKLSPVFSEGARVLTASERNVFEAVARSAHQGKALPAFALT